MRYRPVARGDVVATDQLSPAIAKSRVLRVSRYHSEHFRKNSLAETAITIGTLFRSHRCKSLSAMRQIGTIGTLSDTKNEFSATKVFRFRYARRHAPATAQLRDSERTFRPCRRQPPLPPMGQGPYTGSARLFPTLAKPQTRRHLEDPNAPVLGCPRPLSRGMDEVAGSLLDPRP